MNTIVGFYRYDNGSYIDLYERDHDRLFFVCSIPACIYSPIVDDLLYNLTARRGLIRMRKEHISRILHNYRRYFSADEPVLSGLELEKEGVLI